MTSRADILVFSPRHELQAVVEVKAKRGAGAEWAASLRENLLRHGLVPVAKYFLMVFPDVVYLWRDGEAEGGAPSLVVPTEEALGPFFRIVGERSIDKQGLELVVASWLDTLTDPDRTREQVEASDRWLVESGLYDSIRGGRVEHQAAA